MKTRLWILGLPLPKSKISSLVLLTLRAQLLFWHHSVNRPISPLYSYSSSSVIHPTTVASLATLKMELELCPLHSHGYRMSRAGGRPYRCSCADGYRAGIVAANSYWLCSVDGGDGGDDGIEDRAVVYEQQPDVCVFIDQVIRCKEESPQDHILRWPVWR